MTALLSAVRNLAEVKRRCTVGALGALSGRLAVTTSI
jgi:hypothetical protein